MLLATGEQVTIGLLAMALQALGHPACSFTGAAGGPGHRRGAHPRAHQAHHRRAHRRRARRGQGGGGGGLPGHHRGRRDHHARPRRLRPHRSGAGRRAQGGRLRDLHRRGRRLHRRPQRGAGRPQARPRLVRRDARDGRPGGQGPPGPLGRVRQEVRRARARPLDLQARPGHAGHQGGPGHGRRGRDRHHARPGPGQALDPARAGSAGHRRARVRVAGNAEHRRGHDRAEHQPRRLHRHLLHPHAGRPGARGGSARQRGPGGRRRRA